MFKKMAITLVVLFAAAACGRKSNSGVAANVSEATKDPSLQTRTFVSGCSETPVEYLATALASGGKTLVKGSKVEYQFIGANVTRSTEYYTQQGCGGKPSVTMTEAGSFSIHKNIKTADDARGIDLNFNDLSVKVNDDEGANAANLVKLCGISDWIPGKERDVTSKAKEITCNRQQLPRADMNVYKVDKVDSGVLTFGTPNDGTAKRPTAVDPSVSYTRK